MSRANRNTGGLQGEAHVWFIRPESVREPAILQRCRDMLDAHEHKQLDRFLAADDSHRYLVSHALVRSVLSRYAGVEPSDLCFEQGPHGRPELVCDHLSPLRFNLTHTPGLAACIVTLDDDCGIDAEQLRNRSNSLGVAKRMFSAPELQQLMRCKGQTFLEYFYEHWTLREAYVKARGIGISFPTRQLHFSVEQKEVSARFDVTVDDRGDDWHFQLFRPDDTHIAALALRRGPGTNKRIRTRHFDFND